MQQNVVSPWEWQNSMGFMQANTTNGAERIMVCAGKTLNHQGSDLFHREVLHEKIQRCLENLETVLKEAGLSLENVSRLNYYAGNADAYLIANNALIKYLAKANYHPAAIALAGTTRLNFPPFTLEIEATTVM